MKKTIILLLALVASISFAKAEASFDFTSSLPKGWTATVAPYGFTERGAQFTSSSELTLANVSNVKEVTIACYTNSEKDNDNSITVYIGEVSFGTKQLARATDLTLTFSAAEVVSGDLKIVITKVNKKSVYIKTITIDGTYDAGDIEEEDPLEGLNTDYEYAEPTIIANTENTGSNQAYTFIQNNIKVTCTKGARYETYFSVNAGASLTFTATQPIKAIVVNGYVKKEFEAEASSGEIQYVDASEDEVTAEQVLAVTEVNSNILTITCEKQMQCKSVAIYFTSTPEIHIDDEDDYDYSFEWEPEEQVTMDVTFDSLAYVDETEFLEYPCTDIKLFDRQNNYMLNLIVFVSTLGDESETTILPVGTYPINYVYLEGDDYANTVQASVGGYDDYDFPSYFLTDVTYDEYGYPYEYVPYYLVSGTLEVIAVEGGGQFDVHATTYNGSTINGTYFFGEGEPNIEDAVDHVTFDAKATKVLRNGQLLIERNGECYSVDGKRR